MTARGKAERVLCKRQQFVRVQTHGRRFSSKTLVLLVHDGRDELRRFGLTVSRKVGNAVVRNRVKRRLRSLVQQLDVYAPLGADVVIVARFAARTASYQRLRDDLSWLFNRAQNQVS